MSLSNEEQEGHWRYYRALTGAAARSSTQFDVALPAGRCRAHSFLQSPTSPAAEKPAARVSAEASASQGG
jgi:hypothetical protein